MNINPEVFLFPLNLHFLRNIGPLVTDVRLYKISLSCFLRLRVLAFGTFVMCRKM